LELRLLSKELFYKSKNYILNNARPLDKALFKFEFEEGEYTEVIDELKNFQNEDGGFGNGLEPDIRMPDSSVIVTTVAFQYLNEIKQYPNDVVQPAIEYLISNINFYPEENSIKHYWFSVPLMINNYAHAPWWSLEKLDPLPIDRWPNPSVEVIGYLLKFSKLISQKLHDEIIDDLNAYFSIIPKLTDNVYYNFLCFKRIINDLPTDLQQKCFSFLDRTFSKENHLQAKNFELIKAQWMVTEKSSYLFQKYTETMTNLLNAEINRIPEDGGSHPKWKWGNDDQWVKIEQEWSGKLTYELLVTLKYCNLIEF
jgi:hypothetical protein